MRTAFKVFTIIVAVSIAAACTKEYNNPVPPPVIPPAPTVHKKYGSMKDFYTLNQMHAQQFTADAVSGGTFTASQGSVITIPPSAFVTQQGVPVTGNVAIEFKEIYKKSDMLLNDKTTIQFDGRPLKSGGEFFMRVTSNGVAVQLAPGTYLTVEQPLNGFPFDGDLTAFTALIDTFRWVPANNGDSVGGNSYSSYIFGMFTFNSPVDSGTWCNSDASSFFNQYPQTILTLHQNDDAALYNTDVFLFFTDLNSMVHVYYDSNSDYPYDYAPQGLSCTMVAMGVKDSVLYSAFVPIIIGTNQTVNFSMSKTTDDAFHSQLEGLN